MDAALLAQTSITLDLTLSGLLALVAGILILVMPRSLNYIVATYLIVVGAVDLFNIQL